MHAYNECYLDDAKRHLAAAAHYAINDCGAEADEFFTLFAISGLAYQFSHGNPALISGRSGIELAQDILEHSWEFASGNYPQPSFTENKSPEYWAGWALAQYQWVSGRTFGNIHRVLPFSEVIEMYPLYHEMDISQFCEEAEHRYKERASETNLKRMRTLAGLSQSQLAQRSGIGIRSIQMYEQRINDIDKAQAQAVYKLAHTLGCSIEELLENPSA